MMTLHPFNMKLIFPNPAHSTQWSYLGTFSGPFSNALPLLAIQFQEYLGHPAHHMLSLASHLDKDYFLPLEYFPHLQALFPALLTTVNCGTLGISSSVSFPRKHPSHLPSLLYGMCSISVWQRLVNLSVTLNCLYLKKRRWLLFLALLHLLLD